MYIEDRLFSESEQEVYYSVVLDDSEMRLYSEFQKEFIRKAKKAWKAYAKETNSNLLGGSLSKVPKKIKQTI